MVARTSVKTRLMQNHQPTLRPMWLEPRPAPSTTVRPHFFFFLFSSKGLPQFRGVLAAGGYIKKKITFSAVIPYTTDSRADAATKNPQLRLMFRLAHFHLLRDDDDNGGAHAFPFHFAPASSTASVTLAPRKPRLASRRIVVVRRILAIDRACTFCVLLGFFSLSK